MAPKTHVARDAASKLHSIVPVAIGDQGKTLDGPPPARKDLAIRFEPLFDRRVQHLIRGVVNRQKHQCTRRWLSHVSVASYDESRTL